MIYFSVGKFDLDFEKDTKWFFSDARNIYVDEILFQMEWQKYFH